MSARATAERHARDLVAGNLAGIMGDFSSSVFAELMSTGAMPPQPTTAYEIFSEEAAGEKVRFRVRYANDTDDLLLETTWSEFDGGVWKIVKAEPVVGS